ncbi:unnamed protein product [Brassica rapa subsp. trilocularis]
MQWKQEQVGQCSPQTTRFQRACQTQLQDPLHPCTKKKNKKIDMSMGIAIKH